MCLTNVISFSQITSPFQITDFEFKAYTPDGNSFVPNNYREGNCFNLTKDANQQRGIIHYKNRIDINKPFVFEFTCRFGEDEDKTNIEGADGIAFILHNYDDGNANTSGKNAIGDIGGNLGFASVNNKNITPSFALKFDTYRNEMNQNIILSENEQAKDNLAIFKNGDLTNSGIININPNDIRNNIATVNMTTTKKGLELNGGQIEDGKSRCVRLVWIPGESPTMEIYFDGILYYVLHYNIASEIFNTSSTSGACNVWLAISATTGDRKNNQRVCIQNLYDKLIRTIEPQSICEGGKVKLRLTKSESLKNSEVTWTAIPADINLAGNIEEPEVSPSQTTTYTVVVKNKANTTPTYSYTASVTITVGQSSTSKFLKEIDTYKYTDVLGKPISLDNTICGADKLSDCGFLITGISYFKFLPNPQTDNNKRNTMELIRTNNDGDVLFVKNYFREEYGSILNNVDELRTSDKYRSELHHVLDLGKSNSLDKNNGDGGKNSYCFSDDPIEDLGGTTIDNGYLAIGKSQSKNSPYVGSNIFAHALFLTEYGVIKNSLIFDPLSQFIYGESNFKNSSLSEITIIRKSLSNQVYGIMNANYLQTIDEPAFEENFIYLFKDNEGELFDFKKVDMVSDIDKNDFTDAFFNLKANKAGVKQRVTMLDIREVTKSEYIAIGRITLNTNPPQNINSRLFAIRFKYDFFGDKANIKKTIILKWSKYYDYDLSNSINYNQYNDYLINKAFIAKGNTYQGETPIESVFLLYNTKFNSLPIEKSYNLIEVNYDTGEILNFNKNKNYSIASEDEEIIAIDENNQYIKVINQKVSLLNNEFYIHNILKSTAETKNILFTNFNSNSSVRGDNIEDYSSSDGYSSVFSGNLFNKKSPMPTNDYILMKNKTTESTCFNKEFINDFNIKMKDVNLDIEPIGCRFDLVPHKMITADLFSMSKELCETPVTDCCDVFNTDIKIENITKRDNSIGIIDKCCYKVDLNLKNRSSSCGITQIKVKLADNTIITTYNIGTQPLANGSLSFEFCYAFKDVTNITVELYNGDLIICSRILSVQCACNCASNNNTLLEIVSSKIKSENPNECCYDLYVKNTSPSSTPCMILNNTVSIELPQDFNLSLDLNWTNGGTETIGGITKKKLINKKPTKIGELVYLGKVCMSGMSSPTSLKIISKNETCTTSVEKTFDLICNNSTNCCSNIIISVTKDNEQIAGSDNCCVKLNITGIDNSCKLYFRLFGKTDNLLYYMNYNPVSSNNEIKICIGKDKLKLNKYQFRMDVYDESGNLLCTKEVNMPTDCISCCDMYDFRLIDGCSDAIVYLDKLVESANCVSKIRISKGPNKDNLVEEPLINISNGTPNPYTIVLNPLSFDPNTPPYVICTWYKVELLDSSGNVLCAAKEIYFCKWLFGTPPCATIDVTPH